MDSVNDFLHGKTESHVVHYIVAALIVGATVVLAQVVKVAVGRAIERQRVKGHLEPGVHTRLASARRLVNLVIYLVGFGFAMAEIPQLRTVAAGLLASAGVTTLVLGFAARSTFSNMVAGFFISFAQPLRVGDEVELSSHSGSVEDITMLYTFLRTWDGVMVVIPNELLLSQIIRNRTLANDARSVIVDVTVPAIHDSAGARTALVELAGAVKDLLDPAAPEPTVIVLAVRADGVVLRFRARARDAASALAVANRAREAAALAIFGQRS